MLYILNQEALITLIQFLEIPDMIKGDIIENIDNINTEELWNILEKYGANMKNIAKKQQQVHSAYMRAANHFFEINEQENISDIDVNKW